MQLLFWMGDCVDMMTNHAGGYGWVFDLRYLPYLTTHHWTF